MILKLKATYNMIDFFIYKAKEMGTDFEFAKKTRLNFLYQNLTILDVVFWFCQKKEKNIPEIKSILQKLEKQVKYYTVIFNKEIKQWHSINSDYIPKKIDEKWENKITEYNFFYNCILNTMESVNKILKVKQEQIKLSKQIYKEHKQNKTLKHYKEEMGWINETKHTRIKRIASKIRTGIFDITEFKNIPIETLLDKPVSQDRRLGLYYSPYRDDGKSPSLRVYKETNSWYDFGRSEGGDVIALYQKIHDCDFKAALEGLKKYV